MLKVKFLAVVLLLLVFVLEAESLRGRRGRSRSTPPCSPRTCKVSSWSKWGPCTHQCGTSGKQKRIRKVIAVASCGGSCPFFFSETRSCKRVRDCPNSGAPTGKSYSCLPGYSKTECVVNLVS